MQAVAVIGFTGMVGKVAYNWLKSRGYNMMGLALNRQTHNWDQINKKADWIIISVPTPYDWKKNRVDLSALKETLQKINPGKKVIHKCTVPPGTTEKLQKKFPKIKLLFNPEFLSEKTAAQDFANPDRQIIGYTDKSKKLASKALALLSEAPYECLMKSTEAEMIKFINNYYGALMVIFSNFFYDVAGKFKDLNFNTIKEAASASKWVGNKMGKTYWNIDQSGFRGYGGACFPKDINMLMRWCEKKGVKHEILKATHKANIRMLKEQGMTEEEAEKTKNLDK